MAYRLGILIVHIYPLSYHYVLQVVRGRRGLRGSESYSLIAIFYYYIPHVIFRYHDGITIVSYRITAKTVSYSILPFLSFVENVVFLDDSIYILLPSFALLYVYGREDAEVSYL